MDIQWVNFAGNPGQQDATARRKIKIHVMRRFRQQQRKDAWALSRSSAPVVPTSIHETADSSSSDDDIVATPEAGICTAEAMETVVPFVPNASHVDPFDCLPIPGSPRVHLLLYQSA